MREAAVMIIINEQGYVLGISRKYDKTKYGLVGGKVDPGETPEKAAYREAVEETGVLVHASSFLYKREEPPDSPEGEWFYTYCYLALSWSGEPYNSEEGEVKWLTVNDLTDESSAFPEYNKATFARLKEKYPQIYLCEDR